MKECSPISAVNRAIESSIQEDEQIVPLLKEAILYSMRAKSKRLRPLIFLAVVGDLSFQKRLIEETETELKVATALELLHISSLIHDDLPALDNDKERWGKPTNHLVFTEGVALLAGDTLIAKCFSLIATTSTNDRKKNALIRLLSRTFIALCSGQVLDITSNPSLITPSEKKDIDRLKTGALFAACFEGAALYAECSSNMCRDFQSIGYQFGSIFQELDDYRDQPLDTSEAMQRESMRTLINDHIALFLEAVNQFEARYQQPLHETKRLLQNVLET